ncbi:polyphenol oxidase I, chloroplastic-like [Panicum miliaceum]|uniref:Polyphenol oxidase I, chloroplastic-like n=1 Tax=Panicum miliaceum TaxID=4540 RepID=A0A3L6RIK2_PANMI|nr:polyphenol oxidase I, chloroplastic-like [Panicum miliaceum]
MATPSARASCPLLLLPSPPPACPSMLATKRTQRRRRRSLSCRAAVRFDRRDMLASLTGVAAGGLGAHPGLAAAEDASVSCPRGETVTDKLLACQEAGQKPCPPTSPAAAVVVDFTPPTGPMCVRQPAHLADAETVEKYRQALAAMRALPDSDPCSFASQAAIHQAYCDGHYRYGGPAAASKDAPFDVHFSWIFAPWHRMYIYFYERILGGLIGDDAFALPYWNWDAPAEMATPAIFKDAGSPLYDANRNPAHLGAYVNLDILNARDTVIPFDPQAVQNNNQVVQNNLSALYVQMMRNKKAQDFLGDKFCAEYPGTVSSGTSGSLESMAHTSVHIWAGDLESSTVGNDGQEHTGADMGFLSTAGRDPVFYSHHANVDRMWHLWATKLGRSNFDDPEWLDTSFVFYDEKPQLVRVRVRDVLDAAALRYSYDEREPLRWMDARPTPLLPKGTAAAATTRRSLLRGAAPPPAPAFPLTLTPGQSVEMPSVPRPPRAQKTAAAAGGGTQPDTVLVFDGIEFEPGRGGKFDVVINVPPEQAAAAGPRPGETVVVPLVLPLDEVLADIGVGDEDGAVNVVIVPRTQGIKMISPPRIEIRER